MHELAEEMALSRVPRTKKQEDFGKKHIPQKRNIQKNRTFEKYQIFFLGNLAVQKKLNLASKIMVYQSEGRKITRFWNLKIVMSSHEHWAFVPIECRAKGRNKNSGWFTRFSVFRGLSSHCLGHVGPVSFHQALFWVVVSNIFISTPIWGRFPFWLIFFKGVETTNQYCILRIREVTTSPAPKKLDETPQMIYEAPVYPPKVLFSD